MRYKRKHSRRDRAKVRRLKRQRMERREDAKQEKETDQLLEQAEVITEAQEETKQVEVLEQFTCTTCGVTCDKKRKGVTVGSCRRKAKKAGEERPPCEFITSSPQE